MELAFLTTRPSFPAGTAKTITIRPRPNSNIRNLSKALLDTSSQLACSRNTGCFSLLKSKRVSFLAAALGQNAWIRSFHWKFRFPVGNLEKCTELRRLSLCEQLDVRGASVRVGIRGAGVRQIISHRTRFVSATARLLGCLQGKTTIPDSGDNHECGIHRPRHHGGQHRAERD